MTKIRELVKHYFGIEPKCDLPTDELVMHGAAIEAAKLGGTVDPDSKVGSSASAQHMPEAVLPPTYMTQTAMFCTDG